MPRLTPIPQANDRSGDPVYAAILTDAEYNILLRSREVTEPRSNVRMSPALRIANLANYLVNPDARRREERVPDADERLIVVASPNGGKLEVDYVYRGTLQSDGSLLVNQVKDTTFHFSQTDARTLPLRLKTPTTITADNLAALDQWRTSITQPPKLETRTEGYLTHSPYDPPVEVPRRLPPITRSTARAPGE